MAFLSLVAALCAAFLLHRHLSALPGGRALALSLVFGLAFGALLQRSRFCFYCVSRDFIEQRDARGLLGILAALAVGTLGYHAVFGAFLPEPAPGRLPPGAHIGPVSVVLVGASFTFGLGMALAGSCISAQLYRLGEGALTAPIALAGTVLGFVLGLQAWNALYLRQIQEAPVLWLPHHLGYEGSLAVQLLGLGALAWLLWKFHRTPESPVGLKVAWWQRRWTPHMGGVLIGGLGVLAFLRVSPLGVTSELGSLARTLADQQGWLLPSRLEGLDTFRGCVTTIKETLWSNNGALVVGLVLGAFAAALIAGDFKPRWPTRQEAARNFVGGLLMGLGSMLALGCTVGTLLSGIMAAAVSGWVFLLCAGLGLLLGWRLRWQPWRRTNA
ncbi:MAG TPA: YeeE/YedE family protein [Candidatus Aquabacterium excrementipullorum]|nr:YeeE/YedE family protein [Candidatus Aquabacterium excrementipullorum]